MSVLAPHGDTSPCLFLRSPSLVQEGGNDMKTHVYPYQRSSVINRGRGEGNHITLAVRAFINSVVFLLFSKFSNMFGKRF